MRKTPTIKATETRAPGEARKRRRRRNTRICVLEAVELGEGSPCGGIGVPRSSTRPPSPAPFPEEGGLRPQKIASSTPPFSPWKPRRVFGGASPPFGARGARWLIAARVTRIADAGLRLSLPRLRLVWWNRRFRLRQGGGTRDRGQAAKHHNISSIDHLQQRCY